VLETDSFGYLLTESTGTNGQIVPAGEAASQACFTNELSYSVSVKKEWMGDSKATRPAEVQIQLLHNGQNVGLPILLNEENGWAYTWTGLSEKTGYSVAEARVPEHYTASVRQLGERDFVVINTRVISTVVPPTGDQSQVLLWCFGMLFGMIGTFTIRKRIKR